MKKNINRARQFKSFLVGSSLVIANIAQGQSLFDQPSGLLLKNGMGYKSNPPPSKALTLEASMERFEETSLCLKNLDLSLPTGGNLAYSQISSLFIDADFGMLCKMPTYFPTMFDNNQTSMDEFCGCIAEYLSPENTDLKNRAMLAYRGIDDKSATYLCQKLSNKTIGKALGKTVDDYVVSSVVGTLVSAISGNGSSCRSDQMKEFFTRNLGSAVGSLNGARECSSQATAYMLDQLERNEVDCANENGISGCSLNNLASRELAPGKVNQDRRKELQTLLEGTKKLTPPEGEEPSEEHLRARAGFEKFIKESPMGDIYAASIDSSLKKAIAKAFELSDDVDVSPKKLAELVKSTPNGKSKALRAIFTYVNGLNPNQELGKKVQEMSSNINGMPSLEDIANGYVVLTDEQVDALVKRFAPDVKRTCSKASDNFGKQCKLIASGAPFKNGEKVDNFCDDPALDISGMLSSTFDFRTWEKMIQEDPLIFTRANTQQAMCYHHYRYGGLNDASNRSCERDPITGVKKGLNPSYATPEALALNFFDRVAGPNEETSGVDVKKSIANYDSCTPFVPRALGDEFNPYLEPYKDAQKDGHRGSVISDHYASGGSSDTLDNDYVTSNASKTDSGQRDYITADDGNVAGNDAIKEIEANAKRKVASRTREEVVSEAENFYQSQNLNDLVQQTYTVNRVTTNDVVEESSTGENVPASPEAITSSLQSNEELLRRLEELEQRNTELFKQLQERGVKEIEDANGKTVDINDAFNRTNERIQKRREEAIKERERLKEALAKANNNFVPNQNENGNFGNNNIVQARPGYTPTPGGQNNNSGIVRDNIIAPPNSNVVSSGGGGSFSAPAPVYGPIIGSQGLVLTKEALDLAKPVLHLNGKVLAESPELVKEAIAKVKNELLEHHLELPVQKVDGVEVSEYILQEQDGKTVMVYLDGDKVVVREINVELEKEKVAEVEQDAPQEEVPEKEEVEASGRKTAAWEEVEGLFIESGVVE